MGLSAGDGAAAAAAAAAEEKRAYFRGGGAAVGMIVERRITSEVFEGDGDGGLREGRGGEDKDDGSR